MNVRIPSIIVTVTLLAASEAVVAEGFYVGAGIGNIQIEDAGSGYSVSDFPLGSRFFIGVEVSQELAFEGVFFSSDTATQGTGLPETRAEFSGVAIYATGPAPSGDGGHLMVRLGLFKGNLEIDSVARDFDRGKSGFALGAGYVLNLNKRFAIRGDFDTFISDFDTLSSATIGVQFRFGD